MCAALVSIAVLVLTACSALSTDYGAEAEKLDAEISAMPGVQRLDVSVADDFFLGDSRLHLTTYLPEATEPQIDDVITRIGERIGKFDGLRERDVEFVVGDRATVRSGRDLEVDTLRETVRNVRQYTASVPDVRISWEVRPAPRISVMDVRTGTAEPLAAVRAMIGATTAAEVSIQTTEFAHWTVALPLSADREAVIRQQLSEIPWATKFVEIKDGHIIGLSVQERTPSTFDPDVSYRELADTVRILGPTTDHPLRLDWTWFFYYTDGKRNVGSVHAGGCDYFLSTVSDDALSPAAFSVQRRIREEFDTCR